MILTPTVIDNLGMPELAPYRTLRRPVEHERTGIFVAEGSKVVERLLASSLEIVSCLLTPEWLARFDRLLEGRPDHPKLYVAEKQVVEQIVGFHLHQGAMAVARIPAGPGLEELAMPLEAPRLLVALDGMTNAENVGVLVRNCAAFGVDGIIVGERSSSPYLRRAVRNSMGTVFTMDIVRVENLAATVAHLSQDRNIQTIAADPSAPHHATNDVLGFGRICLIFGSEGEGVSREVRNACQLHVAIPMAGGVDSLNVASASAVLLYEASRHRLLTTRTVE